MLSAFSASLAVSAAFASPALPALLVRFHAENKKFSPGRGLELGFQLQEFNFKLLKTKFPPTSKLLKTIAFTIKKIFLASRKKSRLGAEGSTCRRPTRIFRACKSLNMGSNIHANIWGAWGAEGKTRRNNAARGQLAKSKRLCKSSELRVLPADCRLLQLPDLVSLRAERFELPTF